MARVEDHRLMHSCYGGSGRSGNAAGRSKHWAIIRATRSLLNGVATLESMMVIGLSNSLC